LVSGMNVNTDFNAGGFRRNDPSVYGSTGEADYASRRNVSHYLGEMAEKQEVIQRASFRFANIDFLSKIEYNTRRTYQVLEELAGELPGMLDKLGRKLLKGLHDVADAVNRIPEQKPEDDVPPEDTYPGDGGGSDSGRGGLITRGSGNRNPYRNLTNPGYYGNDGRRNVIVNVDCCACGGKNTGGSSSPVVTTGSESAAASAAGQQAGPIIVSTRKGSKSQELPKSGLGDIDDRHSSQYSGLSVVPGGKGKGQKIEVIPGKGGQVVQFPGKEVPTAKPAKTGAAALLSNGFMSNLGFSVPLLGDTGKPSKGRPGKGILGGLTRGFHGIGSTATDLLIGYGISRYLFPTMDDGFANFDFEKGMEGAGNALKDGGSSIAKFFGWDKAAEDKKHSKDYTAFKDSNLYNWMNDSKDTVADTFKGMYDSVKNSAFVQNTILPFVTNIGKGLKDIVGNTGDDLIQGWEDLKDMDWNSLFSNDTLQKLATIGTGVGLLAGRRFMKNRKYRRDMQNKDEAADAARRNGRGYLTELHIKNRAKRRSFGQTMKDGLFTNSVFTKGGRARGKEQRAYRKQTRTKARQDLKDYYNDVNNGQSLDKYDKYYAEDMMFDRHGEIRPEFLTRYDNGKVIVTRPGEVGDDYNRSHGAYYNGTRVNGEYTTRAYDARYETEPNKFRRFWNKYGSSEKRSAYHEYKEQQRQYDQHEFDSSGGRMGINRRPGFISKAGSMGGDMIKNTLGGMVFGVDPITY
ncbi:MAG TPA: hypothetical protein VNU45_03705, partial [Rummeliibacillus sp.]|nr:hypothetical protein [Rummeliibacillus sp.]